jgi:hypothetical protein
MPTTKCLRPGGWVQVVNFFVYGTLVLAFAIRMRLAIAGTRGSIGAPVARGQQESRGRCCHADQVGADLPEPGCQVGVVGDLVGGLGLAVGEELARDAVHVG